MGNTATNLEPVSSNLEDRLTVLPDYMEREEGDKIFAHREYYNVCQMNKIGISECKTYLRVKFILAKHMKWMIDRDAHSHSKTADKSGMYEVINKQLNGSKYSTVQLLNDYHHLLFTHSQQLQDIYDYLKLNCRLSFCSAMLRNYRDRHYHHDDAHDDNEEKRDAQRSKLYFGYDESQEINVLQLLDKMHCHFLHTFEMGFDVLRQDSNNVDELKYANSNFAVDGYIGFGELHEELNSVDLREMFEQRAQSAHIDEELRNTKRVVYEQSRCLQDLQIYQSQRNVPGYDLREGNKFVTDLQSATVRETKHERQQKYVIGEKYSYWDYFEDVDYWYIAYKHETLKDELLLNESAPITLNQFHDLVEKAECYIATEHCRKIQCTDKRGRPYYGIARREAISIQHLIALFIYCNFHRLQRRFISTYRRTPYNESDEELKLRHSEFHHLGKLIRESVEVFGVNAYQSNVHNFYHAITKQMVFTHSAVYINSILSCTSKLAVALYYCSPYLSQSSTTTTTTADGANEVDLSTKFSADNVTQLDKLDVLDDDTLLLNLNSNSSFYYYSAKYFDCCWLSEFANEMECIFIGSDKPLYIKSILYPSQSFNYQRYLHAIQIIKCMVRGLWYYSLNEDELIVKLLSFDQSIPEYVQKVFDAWRHTVTQIDINHEAMMSEVKDGEICQKGYKFLSHLFYDDENSKEKQSRNRRRKKKKKKEEPDDSKTEERKNEEEVHLIEHADDVDPAEQTVLSKICHVRLESFCAIFPNLQCVFIKNVQLSGRFIRNVLQFLKKKGSGNLQKHHVDQINVYNIEFPAETEDIKDSMESIEQYVDKYWQQFDDFHFKMHKQCIFNDFLCFHKEVMLIANGTAALSDLW